MRHCIIYKLNNVNLPITHRNVHEDQNYEHTGYEKEEKNDISSINFFISIVPPFPLTEGFNWKERL